MTHDIWVARVTDEEWAKLTEQDLDQICDDLEIHFDQLKELQENKGGQK